jgi:hypothetical protein
MTNYFPKGARHYGIEAKFNGKKRHPAPQQVGCGGRRPVVDSIIDGRLYGCACTSCRRDFYTHYGGID